MSSEFATMVMPRNRRKLRPMIAAVMTSLTYVSLGSTRSFGEHRAAVHRLVAISFVLLAGCPNRQNVPCSEDRHCDLSSGGACLAGPSTSSWCAYPDSSCPSGFRYSDFDVGDGVGGTCVDDEGPKDAGIDAPGVPAFDVAYPSEWRFSVAGPVSGYFLVINRGVTPLSMSSLQLKSIDDDHPTAFLRINANPLGTTIAPGQAGGSLTPLAKTVLVDSGLVTEARTDTDSDYLSIEIVNAPTGSYDINATLKLGLDNRDIMMPMILHILPGPTVYADPQVGKRTTIFR
jgi:hypothetical protein